MQIMQEPTGDEIKAITQDDLHANGTQTENDDQPTVVTLTEPTTPESEESPTGTVAVKNGESTTGANEVAKSPIELFDEMFKRIDLTGLNGDLLASAEAVIDLARKNTELWTLRSEQLTALRNAVDFLKRQTLAEKVSQLLAEYSPEQLQNLAPHKLLESGDAIHARKQLEGHRNKIIGLILSSNMLSLATATDEQKQLHRQLNQLAQEINSYIDRLNAGPPELSTWKKEEKTLLESIGSRVDTDDKLLSTFYDIRDFFRSDPRKAEHFKHLHADWQILSALINEVSAHPDRFKVEDAAISLGVIWDQRIKQVAEKGIQRTIEHYKYLHNHDMQRIHIAFANQPRTIVSLVEVLNNQLLTYNMSSEASTQAINSTILHLKKIEQTIGAETAETLKQRVANASYADLLLPADARLSDLVMSVLPAEVDKQLKSKLGSLVFTTARTATNMIELLTVLEDNTVHFPFLGELQQVLQTQWDALNSDAAKSDFLKTGRSKDVSNAVESALSKIRTNVRLREILVGRFKDWVTNLEMQWIAG